MPRLLAIRLSLALTALVLFGLGVNSDSNYLRLAGIVLLGAALILRFAGRRTPRV
ncbi:MAG: hypothetical protein ACR2L6_12945 [Gemmatimonadaceae bacterium]